MRPILGDQFIDKYTKIFTTLVLSFIPRPRPLRESGGLGEKLVFAHLACVLVLNLGADVGVEGEVGTEILEILCGMK